ncbi:hypothetical protein GC194_12715 [bacterium]|nr:hypothetical protein [bacterium]
MSANENEYTRVMALYETPDLLHYVQQPENYHESAVIAAIWELEKRGKMSEKARLLLSELLKKQALAEKEIASQEAGNKASDQIDEDLPVLYSTRFVLLFGAFFSVLGGSVLMAINVKKVSKSTTIIPIIAAGLLFSILQELLLVQFKITNTGVVLLTSIAGMYLLDMLFWRKHAVDEQAYIRKSIWPPILVAIALIIPIMYFAYKTGAIAFVE